MQKSNKAVVLVGGSRSQLPYAQAIAKSGLTLIVVDQNPSAPARILANVFFASSIFEADPIVSFLENLDSVYVCAVLTSSARFEAIQTVSKIGLHFNCVCISEKTLECLESKILMKQALRKRKIPTPNSIECSSDIDFQKIEKFLLENNSIIVKPATGTGGSKGVLKIDNSKSLLRTIKNIKYPFIVEKFLAGREISIDGMVHGEKIVIFSVTEKICWKYRYRSLPAGYKLITASEVKAMQNLIGESFHTIASKVIDAIALDNSLFSMDIILREGKYDVLEVGVMLDAKIDRLLNFISLPIYDLHIAMSLDELSTDIPDVFEHESNALLIFLYAKNVEINADRMSHAHEEHQVYSCVEWNVDKGTLVQSISSVADTIGWYMKKCFDKEMSESQILRKKKSIEYKLRTFSNV